uniref:Putative secreted protein n=1 Tax=Ixodes ricinus TaxID=34613 RepID=A0A6B0U908_IXORI
MPQQSCWCCGRVLLLTCGTATPILALFQGSLEPLQCTLHVVHIQVFDLPRPASRQCLRRGFLGMQTSAAFFPSCRHHFLLMLATSTRLKPHENGRVAGSLPAMWF